MSVLGWFLAVCGVAGVVFALRMMMKMKKMQTVPFKTPSEIATAGASVADAKGMISTEGQAVAGAEPLIAPMSGEPCLAYQITVERKWEKEEETENGTKKNTGSDKFHTVYRGGRFQLTDASGAIDVDVSKEPDADFTQAHSSTIKVGSTIPGSLAFGQMQMNTPQVSRDSRTVAFVGTEKILKPGATMYAMGALKGSTIGTPDGLLGKLTLSSKGRAALLGSTRRNMMLGYAIGGVLAIGGTTLGIFGPKPAASASNSCSNLEGAATCADKITQSNGSDIRWTVPADGKYRVSVLQPNVKRPIDAVLTISDNMGRQVAFNDDDGAGSTNAAVEQEFKAGTYKINVRDFARRKISGGYSYSLSIASTDAPAGGLPVAAIGARPAVCQKAFDCCVAFGSSADSCDVLRKTAPETSCEAILGNFRKNAKHRGKAAISACR